MDVSGGVKNSLLSDLRGSERKTERKVLYEQFINSYSDQVVEGQKQSAHSHLALPLDLAIILLSMLGMRNKLGQSTFKTKFVLLSWSVFGFPMCVR